MAAALGADQRAALRAAHDRRYGYPTATARPPVVAPPPPWTPPPSRTPDVDPPPGRVPGIRALKRPPAWVRAYQRLTYGVTPTAMQDFAALGNSAVSRYEAMVEQQLLWEQIDDSAMEQRLLAAGYTTLGKTLPQLWADHVVNAPDYDTRMRAAWEVQRGSIARAVHSKRQLLERVVTFWHDHFNVQVSDYDAGPVYMHYHRDVIRQHAMGNFRALMEAVAQATSMLFYLDNRSNTRAGPNENFARELLELHTFGAENYLGFVSPTDVPPCPEDPSYPIGYSDLDVYETAACFTGWSVNNGSGGDGTFLYRANNHDTGPKYVLGRYILPEQPPLKDGRDVLDRIAGHPRVAKFICRKLIRHFVADDPPQSLVDSAAAVFLANRTEQFQIRRTLRHILKSEAARESWGNKRRRPTEVMIAALRAAGADWTLRVGHDRSNDFHWRLQGTGHVPYDWPAPNGYPDTAQAWSGANSFVMGWKMLGWLTETNDNGLRLLQVVEVSRDAVPQWTARALVEFWCHRILGYLPASRRLQMLVAFMAQNGDADAFVITDSNDWKGNDLKAHYNQDRLRNMVSMILMSPEFFHR